MFFCPEYPQEHLYLWICHQSYNIQMTHKLSYTKFRLFSNNPSLLKLCKSYNAASFFLKLCSAQNVQDCCSRYKRL